MTRNEEWIDRANTALQVMKDIQCSTVSMQFTRKELIELRMAFTTLKELEEMEQQA